jgi:hypothetical protein
MAVRQQLGPPRELLSERRVSPRSDHLNRRIERFGSKLEPTLVIPLAGRSVHEGGGTHLMRDLDTYLGDQRPRDGGPEQVNPLVLGLPLEDRESKIAAEFFAGIDDTSRGRADLLSLVENRLTIFARLPQIDIHRVDAVPALIEPAEQHTGVQTSGIGQNAIGHRSSDSFKTRTLSQTVRHARAPWALGQAELDC